MKNTQSFNIFKKAWFYIVSVILVFAITILCIYVVPHKLSSIVPTKDIEYVVAYPGPGEEKRIVGDNIDKFVELIDKSKINHFPSFIGMKWVTLQYAEVHYKNGKVISFGPHAYYVGNVYHSLYENTFDFNQINELING